MKTVFIASPYAGDVELNVAYARAALKDSFDRGEAPFVPHILYNQALDDAKEDERARAIAAGLRWLEEADAIAFYIDYGMSPGMDAERKHAEVLGLPIFYRRVGGWRRWEQLGQLLREGA